MAKIFLNEEYSFIFNKIKKGENFLLLRYGDGERAIMTGKKVHAQEGWTSPQCITQLGYDLLDTLNFSNENVYYGISCPCCDIEAYNWYISHIKSKNITFANMFVNINYRSFINDFETLKRDAIIIGNVAGVDNTIGNLNILKYYPVGNKCQEFWPTEGNALIENIIKEFGERENLLFACAAGPMSEPILAALYENNPNNCYIDFGSSIDKYIHHKDTRPYTDPTSTYGSRNCWMPKNKFKMNPILLYPVFRNKAKKIYHNVRRILEIEHI